MSEFSIVDTHVHLWDPSHLNYPWLNDLPALNRPFLPADYREHSGPVNVEKMVFLECDLDPTLFVEEAKWMASLASEEPRLKGIVAHAPLHKGEVVKSDLEALVDVSLVKGVRRLIQGEAVDFCVQPDFVAGVQALAEFGLSFDLCIFHPQLSNTVKLVQQCSDVSFVLDHIGKPGIADGLLDPWREDLEALAELPNVKCKISGMVTEADHENWTPEDLKPYIDHVIETFGFDRVMYGGDWPVSTLATEYPMWVWTLDQALSSCSSDELRKLYWDNAIEFYSLD